MKIGVFVCHCGSNIAGTVDTEKVAAAARKLPGVAFATDTMYACSEPGQEGIVEAVKEHGLDGVVVASCTPRMHEATFRRTVERAGLNRYMFEMANIREHVSWIGKDMDANTNKAAELVAMAVAKLREDRLLFPKKFDINKRVMVLGGGVAGIQAALDCADGGLDVVLVEKTTTIGGKMAKLDKTFPTVDCSSCILGPKMVDIAQHPNITLYAASEVDDVSGYVGNFKVAIRKKQTYVDWDLCTGCGQCMEKCPSKKTPDAFNEFIGPTTAINIPFPQAIPKKASINAEACIMLTKGKCGACAKVCPVEAIRFDQQEEIVHEEVGAIVAATGYDLFDHSKYPEYGGGRIPDVITSMQYERMLSASGPTGGHIKRPSNGEEPKNVVFIQCVGSRDKSVDRPYCSGFCCMYTAKQTILTKDHIPDSQSYVFYMDIRSPGKNYDEFTRRAMEQYGARYIRGRVAQVYEKGDTLIVRGADTLTGTSIEVEADLVVLAVGAESAKGAAQLAEKLRISYDTYGFYMESHPKLKPVETNTAGVFLAGCCQGPKDIPSSVGQGSAAAAKVLAMFSKDQLESDPQISQVDIKRCIGCGKCMSTCPFGAIKEIDFRGQKKAEVIETVCQGCGLCTATCPQGAIQLQHFTDNQILAEVTSLCPPLLEKSFE
ncbi:CoB--CoM heterodisulfide reductase iron-sulfur subunit A family protein [Oceanidesulfovibrio marinus]|uniref:Disulfide reductase n=1 Tax=Oceanidesulfovibrio marinus TaxID=370038 RepID=A0A6P1ZBR9_9BACT|nr:CoB--CoM heterodisulfide reductase iron-sulfur subunit A family protein [Oceanidesulfovibrio marinus]QJT08712.1 CoB--CoM heterodisulfide reductase iron-sulfur subunit A family protein [Oceanidesulfovibrio marinus]QJT09616.1 CoB--CoM heterodisulfide reductase iron-sulfur subunit A family protein [Oceanidesulfovibrio marinus]TVM30063.1 disulfide reductase [Oceanidesulfovibrio marinus]